MRYILLTLLIPFTVQAGEVTGRWKTIDDNTGKPKSIVEIFKDGDLIKGRVAELINPEKPNPVCEKCKGDKKDKPIIGLEFMWGLKSDGDDEWSGGEILDPENGKTYRCRLRLKDGGEKLNVRGYIGISLLGRSQTWLREKN